MAHMLHSVRHGKRTCYEEVVGIHNKDPFECFLATKNRPLMDTVLSKYRSDSDAVKDKPADEQFYKYDIDL